MRWTLIISAIGLFLCFASAELAEPLSWVELEERTRTKAVRQSSKTARNHAVNHDFKYSVDVQAGTVTRDHLATTARNNYGTTMKNTPGMQAGTIYSRFQNAYSYNLVSAPNHRSCLRTSGVHT
jgi:hypothetical protein